MSKRAVMVVDLQNEYFPAGKLPLVGIGKAAANAARLMGAARSHGDMVVHIRHEAPTAEIPFFVPGSHGVDINPLVEPIEGEPVIVKHYPNAFRETNLKQILDAIGVEEIVIVGAMSHMCIDATSRAAADLGYNIVIVHDACATCDVEFEGTKVPAAQVHAAFMSALAFAYGAVTSTTDSLSR